MEFIEIINLFVLFPIGFYLLMKGADMLVDGSASIAKHFKVSDLVIGLTVVSFGTSAPELLVSVKSSLQGVSDIAIGNVFGSNVANVFLILGVASLISSMRVQKNTVITEIPFTLTATLLVGFLANVSFTEKPDILELSRLDGAIILGFFFLFMLYIFSLAKEKSFEEDDEIQEIPMRKSVLYIVLGMAALYLGGEWVVNGAVDIAKRIGFSDKFIGLTIVAFGTSLPELVTSAAAALKKNADIAVGNVVGSNIFNLLWILGIAASIKPLPFDREGNWDIMVMIFASAMIIFSVVVGRKLIIQRWNGIVFLLFYVSYIVYLFYRG